MIVFLLILALFAAKPYLGKNFPYTHDGENHLARFANYKLALKEGQLPPRFAPNLLNHYGYPVFNYNYPLANILSVPFSILKINYEITFKLMVIAFLVFGFFGANLWLKKLGFPVKSRLITLLAFALAPYLTNILYYRGNIGELSALMIFPWLLWLIETSKDKIQTNHLFSSTGKVALWTMFFLSHNVMVLFGTPVLILYALIKHQKLVYKKLELIFGFGSGLLLSLWFWLPAVLEKNLVVLENADLSKGYLAHFPTLDQLLFAPLRFGFSIPGSVDTLSFQIGIIFLFCLLLTIISAKKISSNSIKISLLVNVLAIFFQLSVSKPIWEIIPLANYIQFPWRLTFFVTIFSLPIVAWYFNQASKIGKFFLILIIITQIITQSKLKPADFFHREIITYDVYPASTSTANENMPKAFTFEYFADGNWQPTATILDGTGQVDIHWWQGTKRDYVLNLQTESLITEPTANFAGWETKVNNQLVEYVNNASVGGRIAYQLPVGHYQVVTNFTQNTRSRQIGNWLSLSGLLLVIGVFAWQKIYARQK